MEKLTIIGKKIDDIFHDLRINIADNIMNQNGHIGLFDKTKPIFQINRDVCEKICENIYKPIKDVI